MEVQRSGGSLGGCVIGLVLGLLVGLFVGMRATLGLIGLDEQYLVERISGTSPALVVATAVPTALTAISGAAPGDRIVLKPPLALDSDTNEPELLLISRNYDRGGDTILRFSPDQRQVIWESAPRAEQGYQWLVSYNADMIFLADETSLIALGRDDGALRWEAQLSDSIQWSICRDCLLASDDAVAALSQDGELQVFAAADGSPLWSRRLQEPTRQLIRIDRMIGVIDRLPEPANAAGLYLFELESGSPGGLIAPACTRSDNGWEDQPNIYTQIAIGPQQTLHWYLNSANCLLRLAPGESEIQRWSELPADIRLNDDSFIFSAGQLFAQFESSIVRVAADGSAQILISNPDYQLQPISADAQVLLVEAQRTRGSSRSELWLVDPNSGAQRAAIILSGNTRLYDDNNGDWTSAITPAGVVLVETLADEEQIRYRLFDPATGSEQQTIVLPIEGATSLLRGAYWTRETLFLAADELYAINLADGDIRYRWP